jgi:hypothetical protein
MDLIVLLIYRLIPRTHGLLGYTITFGTTPICRFFKALFFFHGCIRHGSVCFWVSVDRYALHRFACKIWRWVVYLVPGKKATPQNNFNPRQLKNGQTIHYCLGKSLTFFRSPFSCERNRQPSIKFDIDLKVLFIYRLIPRKSGFH